MTILYDEGQQAIATELRRVLEARTSTEALLPLLELVGDYHRPFLGHRRRTGLDRAGASRSA